MCEYNSARHHLFALPPTAPDLTAGCISIGRLDPRPQLSEFENHMARLACNVSSQLFFKVSYSPLFRKILFNKSSLYDIRRMLVVAVNVLLWSQIATRFTLFSNSESWERGSNRPIDMQPAVWWKGFAQYSNSDRAVTIGSGTETKAYHRFFRCACLWLCVLCCDLTTISTCSVHRTSCLFSLRFCLRKAARALSGICGFHEWIPRPRKSLECHPDLRKLESSDNSIKQCTHRKVWTAKASLLTQVSSPDITWALNGVQTH